MAGVSSCRVVVEDLPLKCLEPSSGLEADLVERRAQVPVHLERFALPSGAVERKHELRSQPLPVRMRRDQHLQLARELCVAAEVQVGVDPVLERGQAQVVEPAALDLRERRGRELRQRVPSPEAYCFADRRCGALGIACRERGAALLDEPFEAEEIDVVGLDLEHVAGSPRHERRAMEQLP